ncbi:UDP-3-O-(3-hydroxymyristoyl)glucosamine N-acyltransferase [Holophaga foetida]|uniref:UDP-3-O-(3-hydroxymyristoyl)glucosamine N-acyltransferase n=1 Tax=Holophaga foetida TaxID=35839 RepID=UPI0002473B36|nr:UDP-3-O-(3-hydroxymyristoyl)glucosamine N-acyltransferase [Holophaga foetida]
MSQIEIKAEDLAQRLGGALRHCAPDRVFTCVKPLEEADAGAVSFLANPKYAQKAQESRAGLILADPKAQLGEHPQLIMENPYWGFAQAVGIFHPETEPAWSEAPIHPSATLGHGCRIAPGVTIGARTTLGQNCTLHPGVHIGDDCRIGDDCEIYSGVVLYRRTRLGNRVRIHANSVLGSDGYGYVLVNGRHEKVPQAGYVELEDDVELGACVTIDRGVLGATLVQQGTKIDNLCQVAHNVQIGKHCLIISQVGISGSASLGDYVTMAGKAGVIGHLHIGSRSIVAGNTMVGKDLPEGSFVAGYMARPHRQWLECQAALNRLPAILKRLSRKDSL